MPGPVTIKVEGLRELDASLQSLADDFDLSKTTVRNVMKRGLVEAGQPTAEMARELAPDDPNSPAPDLHTSITVGTRLSSRQRRMHKKADERSFAEAFIGVTGAANVYAHLIEFGDAHFGPRSFLRAAWAATQSQVLTRIRDAVMAQLAKAVVRAQRKALKLKV